MKNIENQNPLIDALRDNFCSLLKERGLTQLDAVRATNISQSQLSNFISGKRGLGGEATLLLVQFMEDQAPKETPNATKA